MPGLSAWVEERWGACRVQERCWAGCGGLGGSCLVVYSALMGATGARGPFSPRSFWWDRRWQDKTWVGLERGVCSLLIRLLQRGFCRRSYGHLRAAWCEVGEFLYCL